MWLLGQLQLEAERRALCDRRQWEDPESALNNDSEEESRQERRALLQVPVVVHLEELVACLRSSAGSSTGRGGGVRRGADGRFTSALHQGPRCLGRRHQERRCRLAWVRRLSRPRKFDAVNVLPAVNSA